MHIVLFCGQTANTRSDAFPDHAFPPHQVREGIAKLPYKRPGFEFWFWHQQVKGREKETPVNLHATYF